MSTFTAILGAVFDWTWRTSLQASVLILLVWVIQRLLRRWLTPRLRYALSLLVLCRLLLPAAPPSSFSVENLLTPVPQPPPLFPFATLPAGATREPVVLVRNHAVSPGSALCATWLCGLLVLGGLAAWRYCQWNRTIRTARSVSDARLLKILEDVRQEVGINRPVSLASIHHLGSPAVFGLWRIHLLLPETSLKFLSDQEWRLVFLHEMTHIRNYDTVLNNILIAVQFLHWFNPLVWVALQRLRADRELVCDAIVVERLKTGERLGYAQVLLRLAEAISDGARAFPSAVPVVSRVSEIKTRVSMIKHHRRSSHIARAVTIACILLLGCLTFTRAQEGEASTEGMATSLPDRSQRDIEWDLIRHEFKTAGYNLPENVLDDLVQETIRSEFGNRATLTRTLQDRGMTYEEFREQIKERFIKANLRAQLPVTNTGASAGETNGIVTVSGTNGVLVTYGRSSIRADRVTVYPEQARIVADGHVIIDQREKDRSGDYLALNGGTNQGHWQQKVDAIEVRYLGPQSVKETEVRRRIRARVGKPFNTVDIDDDVRSLYATGLFYNVHVSTEFSPKGVDLVYNVQCNPRIAELKFTGNSRLSDAQLRKLIRSKVGDVFNERQTFSDAQAIQKAYANAGFKGTEVKYSYDVDQPTGKASVNFQITEKN
ncbi:MAG TPA: M56 family metallopeptidase [Verrucomicrobiae bacterium]|nr:M56 family metallopeptidase [Verrucomicrobiae bacterium]